MPNWRITELLLYHVVVLMCHQCSTHLDALELGNLMDFVHSCNGRLQITRERTEGSLIRSAAQQSWSGTVFRTKDKKPCSKAVDILITFLM